MKQGVHETSESLQSDCHTGRLTVIAHHINMVMKPSPVGRSCFLIGLNVTASLNTDVGATEVLLLCHSIHPYFPCLANIDFNLRNKHYVFFTLLIQA